MQIEAGEYKTRDGDDVTIIAVIDGFAIGYFVEQGAQSVSSWRSSDGGYAGPGEFDLVRKKPKRIKREAWLTVFGGDSGNVAGGGYATKAIAQENKREVCIAIVRVEIDCEEGENLD